MKRSVWLLGGLGCLGSLGLIHVDVAIAQTSDSSSDSTVEIAVPSAYDLLPPDAVELPPIDTYNQQQDLGNDVPAVESVPDVYVESSSPLEANQPYIDTSGDYNLGATQPSTVILSERSTGCQTVVQDGQSTSFCGNNPDDVNSVNLGPVSLSRDGIQWNSSFSLDNFYNISARPFGRMGNGDVQLLYPLSIPAPITSFFGWRMHPISGDYRFHSGTDLGAPMGTPVLAAFSGTVSIADFVDGYGLTVVLEHDDAQTETLYGHLSEVFVQPGDVIEQGDVIGRVGSTGNSTGPHLHFEVRELSDGGWVALSADQALEEALNNFMSGTEIAAVPDKDETATTMSHLGRIATRASSDPTSVAAILRSYYGG
jgi:murein DD-endopeptidase MepM/ murein hydrolase activator NlpD